MSDDEPDDKSSNHPARGLKWLLFSNTGEFVSVWVHKQLTCVCVCVFLINTPSPNCQSIRMLYDNVGSVCVCVCVLWVVVCYYGSVRLAYMNSGASVTS